MGALVIIRSEEKFRIVPVLREYEPFTFSCVSRFGRFVLKGHRSTPSVEDGWASSAR